MRRTWNMLKTAVTGFGSGGVLRHALPLAVADPAGDGDEYAGQTEPAAMAEQQA